MRELSFEKATTVEEGLSAKLVMNNRVRMPWLGLGVFMIEDDEQTSSVVCAGIEHDYRRIDTAAVYRNEVGVGRGIRRAGIARDQLFLTTKVWNDDMRKDRVAEAFEESLDRLQVEYVDLLLLHWPIEGKIVSAWEALLPYYETGQIKALGVSNYLVEHLDELASASDIVPAVNQIEYHPYLQCHDLKAYCEEKGILVEAWSPLMHGGEILQDPILAEIGREHGKSVAQVILRWVLQTGVATIPKTTKVERLIENADIFDFVLSESDMLAIGRLDRGLRSGPDPRNFDF